MRAMTQMLLQCCQQCPHMQLQETCHGVQLAQHHLPSKLHPNGTRCHTLLSPSWRSSCLNFRFLSTVKPMRNLSIHHLGLSPKSPLLWPVLDGTRYCSVLKDSLICVSMSLLQSRREDITENAPNSNLTGLRKNLQFAHNVSAAHKNL